MFNYLKKHAKDISWIILRRSQKFMLDSYFAANEKVDPRKYMVGIGAGALLNIIYGTDVVRPDERERFLNYLFSYADKDIYSLLREFCLEPLPKGTFEDCYTSFRDNYLSSIKSEVDVFSSSLISLAVYSIKEDFCDEECLNSLIDVYEDDFALVAQYYGDIRSHYSKE